MTAAVARARDFDLELALQRAVRLFWTHGYTATSVRQLCDAMDLNPGSFYAAFTSKEVCFARALQCYLDNQPFPRRAEPSAIRTWFDLIVDADRAPRGCLLIIAATELPLLHKDAQRLVQRALAALQGFFTRCLGDREGASEDAELLAAAVTAIHVMARAGVATPRLRAIADRALRAACLS